MSMPPSDAANPVDEAMRLLQQGNARSAADLLYTVVQNDPNYGIAWQYLGVARSQLGELEGGVAALREAARLMPGNAGVHYNLGVALTQAQRTDEARTVLNQALTLDPTNVKARAALERLDAAAPVANVAPAADAAPSSLGTLGGGMGAFGGLSGVGALAGTTAPPVAPPVASAAYPPSPAPSGYSPDTATAHSSGGMAYSPTDAPPLSAQEPSTGRRILRGLGYGALYGQFWTVWLTFWDVIMGGATSKESFGIGTAIIEVIIFAVVFAFIGSFIGLIIGAANLDVGVGAIVGIVAGVALLGLEYLLSGSGFVLLNLFFWFFTGRFVGAGIAAKTSQLVEI